ncbi:unnamed protein product [Citrullus colocynthis]|uniref:Uncharacterized protein n=1 Tax=Citrullus colocynthis TaxID=252529 RepID=A0ABP0XVG1_9ROSI
MLRVRIGSDSLMQSFLLPLWLSMENLKMKREMNGQRARSRGIINLCSGGFLLSGTARGRFSCFDFGSVFFLQGFLQVVFFFFFFLLSGIC